MKLTIEESVNLSQESNSDSIDKFLMLLTYDF